MISDLWPLVSQTWRTARVLFREDLHLRALLRRGLCLTGSRQVHRREVRLRRAIHTLNCARCAAVPTVQNTRYLHSYLNDSQVVLQRRLRHMFTLTATASFLALFIATLTLRNGLSGTILNFRCCRMSLSSALRHLTGILHSALRSLLFTPLAFAGSLPIFVLRKRTITSETCLCRPRYERESDLPATAAPSSTPSRFSQLVALRRSASLTVLSAYMLGAALLSSCYIWSAGQLPWFYFDHK